jgi:hypothetical protein
VLNPFVTIVIFACGLAVAQQETKPASPEGQPNVKINYLNVCAPSADEQVALKSAMARVQTKSPFSRDFEITRGRATLKDAPEAKFVRLRKDFVAESALMTAQYSMSRDADDTIEILVLRTRDPKDFHEISFEDRVSAAAASPVSLLGVDTPVVRIRLERLSKPSAVLARCEGADQNAYEPLFRQASDIMAQYRAALGLRAFRSDIAWLNSESAANRTRSGTAAPKSAK